MHHAHAQTPEHQRGKRARSNFSPPDGVTNTFDEGFNLAPELVRATGRTDSFCPVCKADCGAVKLRNGSNPSAFFRNVTNGGGFGHGEREVIPAVDSPNMTSLTLLIDKSLTRRKQVLGDILREQTVVPSSVKTRRNLPRKSPGSPITSGVWTHAKPVPGGRVRYLPIFFFFLLPGRAME